MKPFIRRAVCFLMLFLLICPQGLALTREEIRSAWESLPKLDDAAALFAEEPDIRNAEAGELSEAAQDQALANVNFLRRLAGLEPVSANPLYALRSQNGALLLAVNDVLTHTPGHPSGMDDALYESAYLGASLGNIAKFNWTSPDILIDGIQYFARDDGDNNLPVLGHRRWLLNPSMAETGFGLACSESGMSYVVMYAVDDGNAQARRDYVCWPADGCFPADQMRKDIAWSVSLDDSVYDASSAVTVRMAEAVSGAEFLLIADADNADGFCTESREACGSGSCIIFRPDLVSGGIDAYEQNQIWQVEIGGLTDKYGDPTEIAYTCEMISLLPQDPANVEISLLEAELTAGETLQLTAAVIPAYADDLSVRWTSSDESIAAVDENGVVTAISEGGCSITASAVNGRSDSCVLHVKDRL